jgi:hypothetical protein
MPGSYRCAIELCLLPVLYALDSERDNALCYAARWRKSSALYAA